MNKLDADFLEFLKATTLQSAEGQGKPVGSKVAAGGSAAAAVVADRDEVVLTRIIEVSVLKEARSKRPQSFQ